MQYRGTNCHGARNLSWCRIFIGGSCAYQGAGLVLIPVSGSESCKKHDKQLTFIVRVSASFGQVTQKLKKTSGAIRQKKAVPNTAGMANCLEYFTLDNDKDLLVSDKCGNHVFYFIIYVTLFLLIVSTFAF